MQASCLHKIRRGLIGHEKLFKVTPLLDLITCTSRLKRDTVIVDEAMIPYKGRVGFLQYTV